MLLRQMTKSDAFPRAGAGLCHRLPCFVPGFLCEGSPSSMARTPLRHLLSHLVAEKPKSWIGRPRPGRGAKGDQSLNLSLQPSWPYRSRARIINGSTQTMQIRHEDDFINVITRYYQYRTRDCGPNRNQRVTQPDLQSASRSDCNMLHTTAFNRVYRAPTQPAHTPVPNPPINWSCAPVPPSFNMCLVRSRHVHGLV